MNNYEKKYINELMKNHYLESESDSDNIQNGGTISNEPYGGFPPIYLCESKQIKEENNKNREYDKHKNAISIKQIMEKRKSVTPFI